jgi:hypothetical protein
VRLKAVMAFEDAITCTRKVTQFEKVNFRRLDSRLGFEIESAVQLSLFVDFSTDTSLEKR